MRAAFTAIFALVYLALRPLSVAYRPICFNNNENLNDDNDVHSLLLQYRLCLHYVA